MHLICVSECLSSWKSFCVIYIYNDYNHRKVGSADKFLLKSQKNESSTVRKEQHHHNSMSDHLVQVAWMICPCESIENQYYKFLEDSKHMVITYLYTLYIFEDPELAYIGKQHCCHQSMWVPNAASLFTRTLPSIFFSMLATSPICDLGILPPLTNQRLNTRLWGELFQNGLNTMPLHESGCTNPWAIYLLTSGSSLWTASIGVQSFAVIPNI